MIYLLLLEVKVQTLVNKVLISILQHIDNSKELKKQVDEGKYAVAFGLYPVTMDHLKWIADTNNIMPPKSTWLEPKLRSGLTIYSIDE